MQTRVTLRPGEKGTKALVEEHGDRLVCVRYRYDATARVRYKTVELIVDQVPGIPASISPPASEDRSATLAGRRAGGLG